MYVWSFQIGFVFVVNIIKQKKNVKLIVIIFALGDTSKLALTTGLGTFTRDFFRGFVILNL